MIASSHLPDAGPLRAPCAVPLLLGFALALAGCGNGALPPAAVPEVPIAPAAPASSAQAGEDAPAEPAPAPPAARAANADPKLGRSKEDAIEVCGPPGQRAYLSRLRCADGKTPTFGRTGNVGERHDPRGNVPESVMMEQMDPRRVLRRGEVDYHIVDLYKVTCSDGDQGLYLDMYHCAGPQTSTPPSGFTMALDGGV